MAVSGTPATAAGYTLVAASGTHSRSGRTGRLDLIVGSTRVSVSLPAVKHGIPSTVIGFTVVSVASAAAAGVEVDLGDNPPITLALELTGDLITTPPPPEARSAQTRRRVQPIVVAVLPVPVIVDGRPTSPAVIGAIDSTATPHQGAGHIRALPPAPTWDGSGYVNPPPTTTRPWLARWVVDDLPDPPSGGYYWLGTPSSADGTSGITSGARQWKPHGSTPRAPSWHSIFPFKPSVRAVDSYLPDGSLVHHAKGVHFNRQFIEHMWMDWGGARRQPFTWVIACLLASYPTAHYQHFVLDSGRNPDSVHFPRLGANDTSTARRIADGLNYRTLLSYSPDWVRMCTRLNEQGPRTLRGNSHGASRHPRMLFGVFNGASSIVGDYGAGSHHLKRGRVDNGADQQHRYYVLGRSNGLMSQASSSHLLVFEIRFWDYAMPTSELAEQYDQLSSTYHFNRYRRY